MNLRENVSEMLFISEVKKDVLDVVYQLIFDSSYSRKYAIHELLKVVDHLGLEEDKFENFLSDIRNKKELTHKIGEIAASTDF